MKGNLGFVHQLASLFSAGHMFSMDTGSPMLRGNPGDYYKGGSKTFKHNRRAELKASRRRRMKASAR